MKKIIYALMALVLVLEVEARAELQPPDIHGFLTTALTQSTYSGLYDGWTSNQMTYLPNSRVGLTLYETLDDQWSAVVQWVGRANQPNFFQEIDWAVIRWQPFERMMIRVGKQQVPTWLISDHREIGYLYPWVRPPTEVYVLNPISSFIGASLNYSLPVVNDWKLNFGANAGGFSVDQKISATTSVTGIGNNSVGATVGLTDGKFLLRAGYFQLNIDMQTISTLYTAIPLSGGSSFMTSISTPVSGAEKFWTVGARADLGNFVFYSEYAASQGDSALLGFTDGAYVTLGYYLFNRKVLPFVTHAGNFTWNSSAGNNKQYSDTFGLNYYVSSNIVLKGDWQWIHVTSGAGRFAVTDTTVGTLGSVSVFDLALSMVF